jgi:AraC-like DNA-binding protein
MFNKSNVKALAESFQHGPASPRWWQGHFLQADYARNYDIATPARDAGMGIAAFPTRFKAITSSPPLPYLKNIRLHKARMLMVNEGVNASGQR